MSQKYINLILILVLLAGVIWVALPNNPGIRIGQFERSLETILGLDLQGGMQVLLEVPENISVDAQAMRDARQILENRANALGVSEVTLQVAGDRRIVGEFPGVTDTEQVVAVLRQTGLLEFVDFGDTPPEVGTIVRTDIFDGAAVDPENAAANETVYRTVMTGAELASVNVSRDQLGEFIINFSLKPEGTQIFADHTTANVGKVLGIVLDKRVISTPVINSAITEGQGIIQGNFTLESANALAVNLRYGSLPVPFELVESRLIGATLGQDSLNKSLQAGIIGFGLVILFMIIYYRLPGALAIAAILNYGLIVLALFKLIPVTLTLPGIAGFLLSTGGALDANILMFERLKEELRSGRTLSQAADLAWKRAWPSIRDSNIATLITSLILFWFGSAYGATIVKGFALTLALGMAVSLFSAIFVTRTLISVSVDLVKPENQYKWFGA
ncbi:MAG: protein translocase subunit SecD [Anaerolineaceae bacterium]|jgi:preprotein translocase subunit SecD